MKKKHPGGGRRPARNALSARLTLLQKPMVAFASRFCSIPTVNPPGEHYLECVQFLAGKLTSLGLSTRILRVPKAVQAKVLPGMADYPRASVVARWDVGAKRTLHFNGHYDVVPATAGWKTDPFKPVISRNRLIARGADDMKCANTAAIFALQAMMEAGIRPPWNIELSFTPDEETGGELGLGYLVKSKLIEPDAAVVCEGASGPNFGYAHKGVLWLDVTVIGKCAHACDPKSGVNALEMACLLVGELKKLERLYARRPTAFRMDKRRLKRPTLMIGGISGGGSKVNTIPDRFHFTIDRRINPEENLPQVKAEIMGVLRRARQRDRKLKLQVKTLLYVPPGWTDLDAGICRTARAACRAVTGKTARFRMTPGFTDMHWLTRDAKVPTILYGTSGGGAHADLEYTRIPSMLQTARVYAEIALRLPAEG